MRIIHLRYPLFIISLVCIGVLLVLNECFPLIQIHRTAHHFNSSSTTDDKSISNDVGNRIKMESIDFDRLMLPNDRIDQEIRVYDNPLILRDRKIVFCWIPKNSCTQFKALFCRYRGRNYTDPYNNDKIHQDRCVDNLFIKKADFSEVYGKLSNYTKLVVLRDPFQRFMSGFLDKCEKAKTLCFDCDTDNISCFIRNLHSYLVETLDQHKHSLRTSVADHFFPQYWFCLFSNFSSQYNKLLLAPQDHNSVDKIRSALINAGLSEKLIMTGWGPKLNDPFLHKTSRSTSFDKRKNTYVQKFLSSAQNVQYFLKIYAVDYVLLDLAFPDWLVEYCCYPPCGCDLQRCITVDCRGNRPLNASSENK